MIDINDIYCIQLEQRIPKLICDFSEKEVHSNPELLADVIIVDDEIRCIVQYFKAIEQFAESSKFAIKNVIACTKSRAAHIVFGCVYKNVTEKISQNQPATDPKLVLLDFHLREEDDSNNYAILTGLVEKVFSLWQKYDIDIVGVSGFAFAEDSSFSPFQQWLRDELIYTFPKVDLWVDERMTIHLHNYLMRTRKETPKDEKRKEGYKLLEKLEEKHGKKKLDSAVILLDAIEAAIDVVEAASNEVSLENLAVFNKDGTAYTKKAFEVEVGNKCDIIAELINNRKKILQYDTRWDRFIHHVKAGTLFGKKLKQQLTV
jgi:hypothetical protein